MRMEARKLEDEADAQFRYLSWLWRSLINTVNFLREIIRCIFYIVFFLTPLHQSRDNSHCEYSCSSHFNSFSLLILQRSLNGKGDAHRRENLSLAVRKRVALSSRTQAPKEEQLSSDFLQLQSQFSDQEQGRAVTEAVLASLLVQCSSHGLQSDFLLSSLQTLVKMGVVRWDSFIPILLRAAEKADKNAPATGGHQGLNVGTAGPQPTGPLAMMMQGTAANPSTPASPSPSSNLLTSPAHGNIVASPAHSGVEYSSVNASQLSSGSGTSVSGARVIIWLRPLVCRVMLAALDGDLKPVTCMDILLHVVQWIQTWDVEADSKEEDSKTRSNNRRLESRMWIHSCVDVIWALIDENKCRVPFYALLHDRTQLQVERWPDDEALFALFLEVHRRRDKIALHMLPLDQHLHCPTFATLRVPALTYPGTMGELLHGEDVATAIPKGSVEWEKAMRCLRQALRACVSTDWWKRVLVLAPRFKKGPQSTGPRTGSMYVGQPSLEFSAEMTCDAVVERVMELMQPLPTGNTNSAVTEASRWQEWLMFADLFYFFMSTGCLDFLELIDKLAVRFANGTVMASNHVTWLLAQVFRLEIVTSALSSDSQVETARKILSLNMAERSVEQTSNATAQALLLDFVGSSQTLRLWSINRTMMENLHGSRVSEHMQKGKVIDEWWKQVMKGEWVLDYAQLDEKAMGMVWVLSNTMTQPISEALMTWFRSSGVSEMMLPGERLSVIHETRPLPMTLLSGLSLHLCLRLLSQIEELTFAGQFVPSIAMVETYVRLLLAAPQNLFRHHLNGMMHRFQSGMAKPGVSLLLLELFNYRLLPLYRFHNKLKQLIFDIAKIIITVKVKRGEHRLFRLAENLGINLILNLKEVLLVKKELKGATTEFTETLNRIMVLNLAFTMKTRGIADFEQMIVLKPALEQILTSSQHTWSEKTMRHFPPLLREALQNRLDKRLQVIQAWQQAEQTVMTHCRQMLVTNPDPTYVQQYITHSLPQHRQFLCAGAWMLMDVDRPESISIANLGRALKELSPEEVTTNVYNMVDVLLNYIHLQLKHGHSLQNLLLATSAGLAHFMWTQELLPFDIVLLALTDRDDDAHALRLVVGLLLDRPEFQQRVQTYYVNRGQTEHWMQQGPFQRPEYPQALGSHLAGKDRFPLYFDDMCLRALPVISLIVYRLIENDATETADRLLLVYAPLIFYHPTRFSFVRDTLAYFYGHLPPKLVLRLISSLDLHKIPNPEAFLQHIKSVNSGNSLSYDYFQNLLMGLVNNVIPPLHGKPGTLAMGADGLSSSRFLNRNQAAANTTTNSPEVNKAFYLHQDPGSYNQLLLDTAVIEILSLPPPPNQIVAMLIHIAVKLPTSFPAVPPKTPLSPSAGGAEALSGQSSTSSAQFVHSPLMIQACGLLLAQLPIVFHSSIYAETARIIKKDGWWLTDPSKQSRDLDAIFGYSTWDPSWGARDDTATVIANTVTLLHTLQSNLPFEWLENMHSVITQQRPFVSVVHLRLAYRIMGPLLPRLLISRPLFAKVLALAWFISIFC
ncbi:hypothetical protein KC19_5G164800 [Ceratodon purpureus]|uniref:Mediator of RNA polymerase II transcription subunit 23 n=1 Tax=Ceratodon purpureus TaxID=3225 RepID=A0A8T0I283_CERPU|nr:hypothetical protein KC19_5G164800 [Ceratodon purpureus]